jgi:hypothetical protein
MLLQAAKFSTGLQVERLEEANAALEAQVDELQHSGIDAAQREVVQLQAQLQAAQDRASQVIASFASFCCA